MSDKTKHFRKNIKDLRKAHNETQMDLALALGFDSVSTISMYENGTREPDLKTIQKIAEHYGITLDKLMRADFSNVDFISINYSWNNMISVFETMYPIVYSEEALKNGNFKKGYIQSNKILHEIQMGDSISRSDFETALEDYSKSLEENDIIEAAANILWLFFVLYSLLPDTKMIKIGEALLNGKISSKKFVKYYTSNYDENDFLSDKAKKAYIQDFNTEILSCIQFLKDSKMYSELGDYYLALTYIIGMVDNDYGQEINKDIGMEMMLSYLSLGNLYAFKFVEKAFSV